MTRNTKWRIEDHSAECAADYRIFTNEGGGFPNYVASVPAYSLGNIGLRRAQMIAKLPQFIAELKHCLNVFREMGSLEEYCDCADRSWYGEGHDTACPNSWAKDHADSIEKLLKEAPNAETDNPAA